MTAPLDEAQLRHWLIDYLVTNIGCSPVDIDLDASLNDLGVGSKDAVVLSGELSELLGRPVSPVEFWEHSTISALARFLTTSDADSAPEAVTQSTQRGMDEPIAVIGVGCRLPGDIAGPEAYWEFLLDNRSAVSQVPSDRWPQFDDGTPEGAAALARTTRWGSFLGDVKGFDSEYFDISPSEADKMDPQQRLLLEVAHEALEHAGIPAQSLRHSQTGVFAGASAGEYGYLATSDLSQVDSWSGTGGALSIIANRVSYYFDLRGPSVTVDTACSSSLVAIHLACQSLRTGDSDLAIAAGVNLLLSPAVTRSFDRADAMSPTGQCHAFDAAADGFVRGEGCGAVILKRVSDALRDGDRILAVVRGSAVNQDGKSNGLMAPNPAAQMAVLRTAYANAGVEPREVDYVEAHGTGTLLGDPIEARALGTVLGRARPADGPLLIGAVKSNLGHLEAAAGVVGFIKAVLAVERGRIPANLGFSDPNPHIPFQKLRIKVVAEHTDWPSVHRPRRAGVSSFGFGGTNAHVVIEEAPVVYHGAPESSRAVTTLVVSGKTDRRVADYAGVLADWLRSADPHLELAEVAHTLDHHRPRHSKFGTVVAADRATAIEGLRALADGGVAPGVVPPHDGTCRGGTVFVYSGQGSQWAGMGRRLLSDEPAFADAVAALEPTFVDQVGFSLRQVLTSTEPVVGIDRIQPVLVGVQLALTELWRSYGVQPDAVIGHSMGEVTASVVAGALSAADGLRVIATRSRLMSRLSGQGAMALIELAPEDAESLVASQPGVTVAVYASPRQSVIAGSPRQVEALVAEVAHRDRLARRIEVDVASHHPTIDPVLPELRAALADLEPRTPSIPLITTTRDNADTAPRFDADYWADNLRNPVRFSQAVAIAGVDNATFVEVSPHPLLTYAIADILGGVHHHSIGTLARDAHDTLTFHTNLNATHTVVPPTSDHGAEPHPMIPPAPWRHTEHWVSQRDKGFHYAAAAPTAGTLLGEHINVSTSTHLWRARLTPQSKPYPGSHRIHGLDVVPASVLVTTLSTAAAQMGATALSDIRFEHPIAVDGPRTVHVVADGQNVTISSSTGEDARWVRHAHARLSAARTVATGALAVGLPADATTSNGQVAALLDAWGVEGQPYEWSVDVLTHNVSGVVADVSLAEPSTVALLDAALHVARLVDTSNPRLMVPSSVAGIHCSAELSDRTGTVEVRRRGGGAGQLIVDIVVKAPDGTVCVEIDALQYTDLDGAGAETAVAHVIDWQPWTDVADSGPAQGGVAVLGDVELRHRLESIGCRSATPADATFVVYVAATGADESDLDGATRMSAEVAALVRELAQPERCQTATLWIVTHGVREADTDAALAQSSLWGLAAVVAAEQPQLWGGLVDVSADAPASAYARELASVLTSTSASVLALRDGQFLAPAVIPVPGQTVREPVRCRPDAAYLVTGGLGALGLLIADWLVDRGARRLILAGRNGLPPRREWDSAALGARMRTTIAAIRALERRGASVDVVALDIGSSHAVDALLAARDLAGAPEIRGVVHAAGVTEDTLVTDLPDDVLQRVMWPKIGGGHALDVAFPAGSLDFFYLTASAGSVFGVPGQGAYAAANAYLDCLARSRHRRGCHTLSLDWVAWDGLGFAADAHLVTQELARLGSRPVRPDEAFAAWEYVDRFDIAQAVMAPLPWESVSAGLEARGVPASEHNWSQMTAAEITRVVEAGLQTILARELRMPEHELEFDVPFAELGLNSVTAMSIRRDAEQLVGIELSATMLWNHPTIADLARYLTALVAPQTESAESDESDGGSVLDSLFDSIESTPAGIENGI